MGLSIGFTTPAWAAPALFVEPGTVNPGGVVELTLTGCPATSEVVIGRPGAESPIAAQWYGVDWRATTAAPDHTGTYTFTATCTDYLGSVESVSAGLVVDGPGPAEPNRKLVPDRGSVRSQEYVVVRGYSCSATSAAAASVYVRFDAIPIMLLTPEVAADGSWVETVPIYSNFAPPLGSETVTAACVRGEDSFLYEPLKILVDPAAPSGAEILSFDADPAACAVTVSGRALSYNIGHRLAAWPVVDGPYYFWPAGVMEFGTPWSVSWDVSTEAREQSPDGFVVAQINRLDPITITGTSDTIPWTDLPLDVRVRCLGDEVPDDTTSATPPPPSDSPTTTPVASSWTPAALPTTRATGTEVAGAPANRHLSRTGVELGGLGITGLLLTIAGMGVLSFLRRTTPTRPRS